MENAVNKKRQFLGKTDNFTDKKDRVFNQRMLKAYLAGHKYFHYGYEYAFGNRQPQRHLVLQS